MLLRRRILLCCALLLAPLARAGLVLAPAVQQTADELLLSVELQPEAEVLAALQAHIELPFRIDRRCGGLHQVAQIALRLQPLSADYVLVLADRSEHRFRLRAEALAAFRRLALPRPLSCGTQPASIRVRIDRARLPAPLRLPSLYGHAWRLDSGWVEVHDPTVAPPEPPQ